MPGLGKLVGKAFNAGKKETRYGKPGVPEIKPDFAASAQPWPHNDKLVAASYKLPRDPDTPIPPNYAVWSSGGQDYVVRRNLLDKKKVKRGAHLAAE